MCFGPLRFALVGSGALDQGFGWLRSALVGSGPLPCRVSHCVSLCETKRQAARQALPLGPRVQTKVEHLDGAVRSYFDVRGLEITMEDAQIVRGHKGFGWSRSAHEKSVCA
jgi:hypothetical protein